MTLPTSGLITFALHRRRLGNDPLSRLSRRERNDPRPGRLGRGRVGLASRASTATSSCASAALARGGIRTRRCCSSAWSAAARAGSRPPMRPALRVPRKSPRAMIPVDLGGRAQAYIVPGLFCEPAPGAADVMRGEETLVLGVGVENGLVCLPGHASQMGRDARRAHRALRHLHDRRDVRAPARAFDDRAAGDRARRSGRLRSRASTPPSATAATAGSERVGLLHLLFGARAAVVSGRMSPDLLGPYLSGLLTGDEINGALSQFSHPDAGDHRRRFAARRPLRRGARPPRHRDHRQAAAGRAARRAWPAILRERRGLTASTCSRSGRRRQVRRRGWPAVHSSRYAPTGHISSPLSTSGMDHVSQSPKASLVAEHLRV